MKLATRSSVVRAARAAAAVALLLLAAGWPKRNTAWQTLEGCRLLPNAANDGDSFHVLHRGKEYIFRLYFADAPETSEQVPERLAEQAEHWGLEPRKVMAAGEEAGRFTAEFLRRPFTVRTRMQDARGSSRRKRYYALVEADGRPLHEALVEAGLARVYGMWADLPDGTAARDHVKALDRLEKAARRGARGAWKARAGSMARLREVVAHVEPQSLRLAVAVGLHSSDPIPVRIGQLPAGTEIEVVEGRSALLVRVRVPRGDEEPREGLCRRDELMAAGMKP
jgi:endonuclease YncB( thermonuclease family)